MLSRRFILTARPSVLRIPAHILRPTAAATVRFNTTFPQKNQAAESFTARKPVEVLIKNDHRSFEELYDRYKKNAGNAEEQQAIINELIREVAQHSIAEETVVYPLIEERNILGSGEHIADHLRQDHFEVKKLLLKLDKMRVGDKGFDETLNNVMRVLKEHATEEETKELPEIAKVIPEPERIDLSKAFLRRKAISPTHPHPHAPDKPPTLEVLAGLPVAPIDKLRDQTRKFAERRIPQE
ncbi:uncharacterized protein SPPG_07668 [Spizellomyces punctatus DAOM BR117]|uniref:Hemerythrin-like domain-containing protein n=1 Tax=Spizellomyces punctatus (strain DAOM BR117) TaxID=645134 RepID=A0A0L0H781_SPIPD|nr:uncharacterized protein SPPG_07668 [Spizellomyces punctatus DAOM BR117]KNC96834.1 hypothetical protein SPPG_07668 [Spizellomyces punctatus DAOM BR117]|eukprot:XP_016604874.1 hypothetical protein SPPG_07668 [Spizellomyces punctatus DAOM BR117]